MNEISMSERCGVFGLKFGSETLLCIFAIARRQTACHGPVCHEASELLCAVLVLPGLEIGFAPVEQQTNIAWDVT